MRYFLGVDTACTKKTYFWWVDTADMKQDSVFSGGGYCVYRTVRSIFGGLILLILSTTKYFRAVITAYTEQYAVFSGC